MPARETAPVSGKGVAAARHPPRSAPHPNRRLPPLGILPCGRGNSFARDLGLDSVEDGLDALAGGRLQPVDVCRFTQPDGPGYFVNLMGLGFVTDVAVTAARLPWLGDAGYAVGGFHRVLGLKPHRLTLDADGERIEADNCFVEICNSRYTGGAMCMVPDARLDDGFFDVVLLAPLSRLKIDRQLPRDLQGDPWQPEGSPFHPRPPGYHRHRTGKETPARRRGLGGDAHPRGSSAPGA